MKRLTITLSLALVGIFANAQGWEYWRNPDGYLNDQTQVLLRHIDATLQQEPPTATPSAARQLALAALDAVTHEPRWDTSAVLHSFLDLRIGRALEKLQLPARKGLEVFKLYNDSFIVRTRSTSVGFDICGTRGKNIIIGDELLHNILSHCDILFISHKDPDHADRRVVKMALELEIPVYGPEDCTIEGVRHVRQEDFATVTLSDRKGRSLKVQPLPGHQDDLQNNIYVVTMPEGYSVVQTGDQWRRDDLPWLTKVSEKLAKRPDLLIIDCWAMEMEQTIRAFNPRRVLAGHENELGHTIDHREALWLTQYKFDTMALPMPCFVAAWGESLRFK